MHPKTPKWLEDIVDRSTFILDRTANRTLADYEADERLHSAIERNVGIVGEALGRIERIDPETAARFIDVRTMISLRRHLIHEYDMTDHALIWGIIREVLPAVKTDAEALLGKAGIPEDDTD